MSNIHQGPLATYNSLTDRNLSGYFGNTRMRRQLRSAGLINRRGELVSENQYRINMARKEHKKHVKELLAQAIVHKTLDLERYRQVEIKKKLEEISKIELVRRVRADLAKKQDESLLPLLSARPGTAKSKRAHRREVERTLKKPSTLIDMERSEMKDNLRPSSATRNVATRGRKGDEEVLPYLSPRSRPQSAKYSDASSGKRPKSAPAPRRTRGNKYEEVIYVDEDGRPMSPPPSDRQSDRQTMQGVSRADEIDTRHLYALDSEALQRYALRLSKMDKGQDGSSSPYLISQVPVPPHQPRAQSARSPRRSARMSARSSSNRDRKQNVRDSHLEGSKKHPDTVEDYSSDSEHFEGSLMLHRQEPAMMHQGEVQTMCEITMKYHGPNLTLPRDQSDPTQEVAIEQQHCGGNTLPVFKERLQAGSTFAFVSRRHRGYPFSLSLYIDSRLDCRVSTCCEYKHAIGVKLGGKMGHFSLVGVTGATPCYKCKLSVQAPPRSLKVARASQKKKPSQQQQPQEEVMVEGNQKKSREEPITSVSGHDDEDKSGAETIRVSEKGDSRNMSERSERGRNVVVQVEDDFSKTEASAVPPQNVDKYTAHKVAPKLKSRDSNQTGNKQVSTSEKRSEPTSSRTESRKNLYKQKSNANNSDTNSYSDGLFSGASSSRSKSNSKRRNSKTKGGNNSTMDHAESEEMASSARNGSKCLDEPSLSDQDTDNEIHEEIFNENSDDEVVEAINSEKTTKSESEIKEIISTSEHGNRDMKPRSHDSMIAEAIDSEKTTNSESAMQENISTSEHGTSSNRDLKPRSDESMTEEMSNQRDDKTTKDNYDDDFEDEDNKGVAIPVDITSASDIELLNRTKETGKRVVLEVEEGSTENVSAIIEYDEDSDVVVVKRLRRVGTVGYTTAPDPMSLPPVTGTYERRSPAEGALDDNMPVDLVGPHSTHVHGTFKKPTKKSASFLSPCVSENKPQHSSGKKTLQKQNSMDGRFTSKAGSESVSSRSSISRHKGSSSSQSTKYVTQSSPEWPTSCSEKPDLLNRPASAFDYPITKSAKSNSRPTSSSGRVIKQRSQQELEDLRAKFYPPAHDCVGKDIRKHKRELLHRKLPSYSKRLFRDKEFDISLESNTNTMAKSENNIDTVISNILDVSESINSDTDNTDKYMKQRNPLNVRLPSIDDVETVDEVSDIESELETELQHHAAESNVPPLNLNINVNIPQRQRNKSPKKDKKGHTKFSQDTTGVSPAFAAHMLKQKQPPISSAKRSTSPKRNRSPSPKRAAMKDIKNHVEASKAELAKELENSIGVFGDKLQEQQQQFANQLQGAQSQFAQDLSKAQASIAAHAGSVKGDISNQLTDVQETISDQLKESQKQLTEQLEDAQKTLAEQLKESQMMLVGQFKESQGKFGEIVKDSQTVMANQLKDSQSAFGNQVENSQKLLSNQLSESQKTLSNQMKDTQVMFTEQLKDSQQLLANQVKDSQQMITGQLKDSQEAISKQLQLSQKNFAHQVQESKQSLSSQLTDSQDTLTGQTVNAQQRIADELNNSQEALAKQLKEEHKLLSDKLISSQQTIDNQLHDSQSKISEQLVQTQQEMDSKLINTLESISKQESSARERMKKDSEQAHTNLIKQEEIAKVKLQQESVETQRRLVEQEEATREKLKKDSEETQRRLAEQEKQAKEELERERQETQRRLDESEQKAREQMQKESADAQRKLAVQEQLARDKLEKDREETEKRLAEQELRVKEEMKKESEESAKRLADQELMARETLQKESDETAKRFAEQEERAKAEISDQSDKAAKLLVTHKNEAVEGLQKEREASAKRLAEQEQAAVDALVKESIDTAKRSVEQEQLERQQMASVKVDPDQNQNYLPLDSRDGRETPEEIRTPQQYEDDFEDEDLDKRDRRFIIGLEDDETREDGKTVSVEMKETKEEEAAIPVHRRIEGYSSDDEDLEGPRKVTVDIHEDTKESVAKTPARRRHSSSSSSSSSSSASSSSTIKEDTREGLSWKEEKERLEKEAAVSKSARTDVSTDRTDRSSTSTTSGDLTTATDSTRDSYRQREKKKKLEMEKARHRTNTSSSSSSSSSDTEDEHVDRKKREQRRMEEEARRKQEEAGREAERAKRQAEEQKRSQAAAVERAAKVEAERRAAEEQKRKLEEERERRERQASLRKEEEDQRKEEERQARLLEEQRMQREHEKDLKKMQYIRQESDRQLSMSLEEESPRPAQARRRSTSSSSSGSSGSSGSSSGSETEDSRTKKTKSASPPPPPAQKSIVQARNVASSTSGSSETSTSGSDSERDKRKPVKPMSTLTEERKPTPPKPKFSSSSSSYSSTSESERESAKHKADTAPLPQQAIQPKPAARRQLITSSSGSTSESETEDEKPKPVIADKQAELQTAAPTKPLPPTPGTKKSSSSSSGSSTSGSSSSSESEVDKKPVHASEKVAEPQIPAFGLARDEAIIQKEHKTETAEQKVEQRPAEKKNKSESEDSSSDSDSSSSSSSDSDSEDEDRRRKLLQKDAKGTTSESEGETMHGGNDPDNVADLGGKGVAPPAKQKAREPTPHDGSILPLILDQKDVYLNGMLLNQVQVTQFANYVVEKEDVNTVTVRNAGIDDVTFPQVALAIQVSRSTPRILNIGTNKLGAKSMIPLGTLVRKKPSMEVLILDGNPLGDEGCKQLTYSLLAKDPFPFLRRTSDYITPVESRDLPPTNVYSQPPPPPLKTSFCNLKELNLGDTDLSDDGLKDVTMLLETNILELTALNLNGNRGITPIGWERLGEALKQNTTLRTLSLDFCSLGNSGLEALAKGLRVNTTLQCLELESTGLSERGGVVLRDLLKSNTSILQLTAVPGNSVSPDMVEEINKYLALNNSGVES